MMLHGLNKITTPEAMTTPQPAASDECAECGRTYFEHQERPDILEVCRKFRAKPVEAEGPTKWVCPACDSGRGQHTDECQQGGCQLHEVARGAGAEATGKSDRSDNELINTFMGLKSRVVRSGDYPFTVWYRDDPYNWFSQPEYDKDWNALMPVVEKLHSTISEHDQSFAGLVLFELGIAAPLDMVYKEVVEAVKYCNSTHTS